MTSLAARDRNWLIGCSVLAALLILVLAVFSKSRQKEEDPTPSSYSTGEHGARAAFEMLASAGYKVQRQDAPLSGIIDSIDAQTTLVIAEPFLQDMEESRATLSKALERGARVLVTGASGAMLVPGGDGLAFQSLPVPLPCEAEPNGFGKIAGSGKVQMRASVRWPVTEPLQEIEYTCDGKAVVVKYPSGKGQVVWWAGSFPLENTGIQQENNLALFLNSIGPVTNHIIWDESLHGSSRSIWSYASGTAIQLVWGQSVLLGCLLLFSYSRRSGPLRPDPIVSRATPVEFVRSLGSLYYKAGAASAAVAIAYRRLRHKLEKQFDVQQSLSADDPAMLDLLTRCFGSRAAAVQKDLLACENAAEIRSLSVRQALTLVQALHDDEALISARAVTE